MALVFVVAGTVISFVILLLIRRKIPVPFALAMVWYFGWLFVLMWLGGLFLFVTGHTHRRGALSTSVDGIIVETSTMPDHALQRTAADHRGYNWHGSRSP